MKMMLPATAPATIKAVSDVAVGIALVAFEAEVVAATEVLGEVVVRVEKDEVVVMGEGDEGAEGKGRNLLVNKLIH